MKNLGQVCEPPPDRAEQGERSEPRMSEANEPHGSHTGATRVVRSSQHGWLDTSGRRVKTKPQRSKKRGVAERSEVGVNFLT